MVSRFRNVVRAVALTSGLVLPITLGALCFAQQGNRPAPGEKAGHFYKNLKVLKDRPAEQIIPIMHAFNDSLGVKCNGCHAGRDWTSDANPNKNAARAMITMTESISKSQKVLKNKATCFMCHHGSLEPQTHPAESTPSAPK